MIRFPYTFFLFSVVALTACAKQSEKPLQQPESTKKTATTPPGSDHNAASGETSAKYDHIREVFSTIAPGVTVDYIGPAQFPGFSEVVVGGHVFYVTNDAHYLFEAQPFDLQKKSFSAGKGLLGFRSEQLAKIPASERIIFSPAHPKYTVTIFTDITCGYCRKLHSQINEYNAQGIRIEYVAFPRMGLGTKDYHDMVQVWCSKDRNQALTDAKLDLPLKGPTDCTNPVAKEYGIGLRIGVNGTPAIFTDDGSQIGGYLTPEQMRAVLDQNQNQAPGQ